MWRAIAAIAAAAWAMADPGAAQPLSPYASAAEEQATMTEGSITSEALVRLDMARIEQIDRAGPRLNSVLAVNPKALDEARAMDRERRAGRVRGPLHGVPVLVKDNVETADGVPTTAGSLALAGNATGRDAPIVARLRAAGAVILGKTNLSEWANFRSTDSISGWSAVGGLVRNPHGLDRTACGSSSGSGAAVAAGIAALAIGTETDGSVTCPAAMTGIVGLKPTVGLVSRRLIVPISAEQDTPGPMTRTVADAAALLTVIAGTDPEDPATAGADAHKQDYVAALDAKALAGVRIGVVRGVLSGSPRTEAVFQSALDAMTRAGAVLVEVKSPDEAVTAKVGEGELDALMTEFKAAIDAYLATTPPAVKTRTLADLIAFNKAEPRETALFGQDIFERSQAKPPISDAAYRKTRDDIRRIARAELDRMLSEGKVEALVAPGGGPPSIVDPVNGGRFFGSFSGLPAVAGYPHLSVPMGDVDGLPVGLSLVGAPWSEARLLALGYAFEQATHARRTPDFRPSQAVRPEVARAYDPR